MSDPALVRFIRDVLGCGCPDEVLQSITLERGRLVPTLEAETTRMDVGGRLLVYVLPVTAKKLLGPVVARALEAGVADRDDHGFNRFRLALATPSPEALESAARAAFAALELPDDRVHLHVIAIEQWLSSIGDG